MITIIEATDDYDYDVRALTKAFYPREELKVENHMGGSSLADLKLKDTSLYSGIKIYLFFNDITVEIEGSVDNEVFFQESNHLIEPSKHLLKNLIKRTLYICLAKISSRELPWGTLTGVRPTKIALEKLEAGIPESRIKSMMEKEYYCSKEKIDLSLRVAKKELDILQDIDYKNGYSIYIGIPFCPSTCLYCSFTSFSCEKYEDMIEPYLKALFQEITYAGTCLPTKKLSSLYIGGGTPTTLSASQLDRLLTHVEQHLHPTKSAEYTVEAGRPDSVTFDKLVVLKKHGVTRISINPQTMQQDTLNLIGRKHTTLQIEEAFHMAREVGHNNINMDIIIGLPGEDTAHVEDTLKQLESLNPDNLTVHTLALKRAARLNIQKDSYQSYLYGDTIAMLDATRIFTDSKGYHPYYLYRQKNMAENLENVGYAKQGKEGIYNILIMEDKQSILALGAGGLSKFIFPKENRIERVENVKSLKDYIERIDEMMERKHSFLTENAQFL